MAQERPFGLWMGRTTGAVGAHSYHARPGSDRRHSDTASVPPASTRTGAEKGRKSGNQENMPSEKVGG